MLYWVFDLDNTLYQLPRNIDFNYRYLKPNAKLRQQLQILPLKKILFTNGTKGHAKRCVDLLQINDIFDNYVCREDVDYIMKPEVYAFNKLYMLNNITQNDKVVFFEDSIENLIVAKNKFGWITVFIYPKRIKLKEIDFWFPNIYAALTFFLDKINLNF